MSRPKLLRDEQENIIRQKPESISATITSPFSLSIKVLGKLWKSTGTTFEDALSKLQIRNARGMSVWTVNYNGKERIKVIASPLTFRIFNTLGSSRKIVINNVKSLFGI